MWFFVHTKDLHCEAGEKHSWIKTPNLLKTGFNEMFSIYSAT